jgi:hypothetical protein
MKCQFAECSNQATKILSRPIVGQEQENLRTHPTQNSSTLPVEARIRVCEEHLEKAQQEYPRLEE